jgi:hypothetical protein
LVVTISLPTKKGERLTVDLPAAYLLFWITTLIVSMGWMTAEATLPDREPTRNGLAYPQKTLYPSLILKIIIKVTKSIPDGNYDAR